MNNFSSCNFPAFQSLASQWDTMPLHVVLSFATRAIFWIIIVSISTSSQPDMLHDFRSPRAPFSVIDIPTSGCTSRQSPSGPPVSPQCGQSTSADAGKLPSPLS
jgi:hypothetical protein